jgi:hypothetical protein
MIRKNERIYSLFLRVDKRTLVSIEKEFEVLKNEGFDILFLKQDQKSEYPLSQESGNSLVLENQTPRNGCPPVA